MDFQSRLKAAAVGNVGAVTIEAALGIGALLASFGLVLQLGLIGVQYNRMLAVAVEAAQMAGASGDLVLRMHQAQSWAEGQLPNASIQIWPGDLDVKLQIRQSLPLFGINWERELVVSESAIRVDAAGW